MLTVALVRGVFEFRIAACELRSLLELLLERRRLSLGEREMGAELLHMLTDCIELDAFAFDLLRERLLAFREGFAQFVNVSQQGFMVAGQDFQRSRELVTLGCGPVQAGERERLRVRPGRRPDCVHESRGSRRRGCGIECYSRSGSLGANLIQQLLNCRVAAASEDGANRGSVRAVRVRVAQRGKNVFASDAGSRGTSRFGCRPSLGATICSQPAFSSIYISAATKCSQKRLSGGTLGISSRFRTDLRSKTNKSYG